VVDEGVIVEIVRPGTGDPVPDGEVGEVVVTVLQPDYPLLRFGTGDLSAVLAGPCPTGRTNTAHQGLAGPRRPDGQGARHVRAPQPGGRGAAPPPRGAARRGWWSKARWPTTA
jgi:phenylacetate-coenzyme A ligase PaaK-like adenylate-forming protein